MINDILSNQRSCGSCEFWSGVRQLKPNSGGRVFQVENYYSVHTVALCVCGNSEHVSRQRTPNSVTCRCYQKWHALK